MNQNDQLLVTGASGHLGQLVLEALLKSGQHQIIATTRNPEKLSSFAKKGVQVRSADFIKPASLVEAFKGAHRLLLISTDTIGSRGEQHKNAIDAAKKSGIQHIVYTSWPNPEQSPAFVSPEHAATEKLIRESGLSYTILRNYPYAENLFMSLPSALQMGTYYGAAGQGRVAYVTRQDCAEAGAGALISADTYKNAVLDVTGPHAYSYEDVVKIVGEIKGIKLPYVDLAPGAFKEALLKSGLPEMWADGFVSFDLAYKKGDLEKVSDTVLKLSGKQPQDLKEFLKQNLK
jgi:NAD(P)H dehydrogenase (quinone)